MRAAARVSLALLLSLPALAGPDTSGGIAWEKSVASAKERAKKEKKSIVVDFWANWCGWCKVQDKEVFANQKMVAFSKSHVYLKLNTEDNGDGTKLAMGFGVMSLPTILVMDADGNEMDRIPGYVPVDAFIEKLKAILEGKGEFQTLARKATPTAQELIRLASLYIERNNVDGARTAFTKVVERDPANKDGFSDEALFFLGRIAMATGKTTEARKLFEDYLKKYPNEDAATGVRRMLDTMPKVGPASPSSQAVDPRELRMLMMEMESATAEPEVRAEKLDRYEELPDVDLTDIPDVARQALLDRLNTEPCTCGCEGDTVAQCVHVDPACRVAPKLARAMVDEARAALRASR